MPYLLLIFLIVPIVEIYLIVQVGQQIGALQVVALLVAISVLGAWLVRREGARTWRAFTEAMGTGRVPAREVADGALVLFGGALLLTPGFLSDLLGMLCILPPTRAGLRGALLRFVTRRGARVRGEKNQATRLGGKPRGLG